MSTEILILSENLQIQSRVTSPFVMKASMTVGALLA